MYELSLTLKTIGKDSISGIVREKEQEVLPFAGVTIKTTDKQSLELSTDSLGNFKTQIPKGFNGIQIDYIGFRSLIVNMK